MPLCAVIGKVFDVEVLFMKNMIKSKIHRNFRANRHTPKTFFAFWIFQLIAIVFIRLFIVDDFSFISIMSVWSVLCFVAVLFQHLYLTGDKNWMAIPVISYIPYWIIFFLIPMRIIIQESYEAKMESLIVFENWPAVVFTASIGICFFLGGYFHIAGKKKKKYVFRKSLGAGEVKVIQISAWILLFITLAAFSILMLSGGTRLYEGGYVHINYLDWNARVMFQAFNTAFRGAIVLWAIYLLIYDRLRWRHVIPTSCLGIMLLANILSGDRGLFAWSGICILVIYSQRRSLRLRHILCVLLMASIAFGAIQTIRTKEDRSITAYISAITEDIDPFIGITQYAESSAPTVTNAFSAVDQTGHFHGTFFMQGLLSIMPFYDKLLPWLPSAKDIGMSGTASFMTYYIFGYMPYGVGTSIITDIYIDFGLIGVSVIMLLYGLLSAYLYNCRDGGKYHFGLLCYALFFSTFMTAIRGTATHSIRLIWTILLCYVIFKIAYNIVRGRDYRGPKVWGICGKMMLGR